MSKSIVRVCEVKQYEKVSICMKAHVRPAAIVYGFLEDVRNPQSELIILVLAAQTVSIREGKCNSRVHPPRN